ncbi:MAG TPA: bifunctional DNA-formamidopyrimidine glycosylase/DNA-(apurinic or apyrimidinic site) lyase [Actinomycetes bacterium]|nr:bifunctional DNA-formamidopyrimidine glycosylase/DNA-(apurinic or apyrimidinic site) lyase [Actinomycetes bacterium]
MPELPEVETVRRGLTTAVAGRTVQQVEVFHPRAVRRHVAGARDFSARLVGQRFEEPLRRGKYLWLPVGDEQALVAHLGMSGQFRDASPADVDGPHLRVRFRLDNGRQLRFIDQRTFGGLAIEPLATNGVPQSMQHIALDPFDSDYDLACAVAAIRRRRTQIKRALLDQTLVSGIGNIYADEALWRAGLHFARATDRLARAQVRSVLEAAAGVMSDALAVGGTSFDALYINVNGESGYFERSLDVYGREGEPCSRCATPIRRSAFTNRSSFFCPRCQPRQRPTPVRSTPARRPAGR